MISRLVCKIDCIKLDSPLKVARVSKSWTSKVHSNQFSKLRQKPTAVCNQYWLYKIVLVNRRARKLRVSVLLIRFLALLLRWHHLATEWGESILNYTRIGPSKTQLLRACNGLLMVLGFSKTSKTKSERPRHRRFFVTVWCHTSHHLASCPL